METTFNRVLCIEVKCVDNYDESEMDETLRYTVNQLRDNMVGKVIDDKGTTITDIYDGGECTMEY